MPTIGKIKVNLDGDARGFQRTMRGAERRVRTFGDSMRGMGRLITGVAGALGFGLLIRSTTEEALRAQQLADRLGTNVDQFSRLARVMRRAGVGMNQTATMTQRMLRRAAEAREGNEKLAAAFEKLGIDVQSFIQLDPVAAFVLLGRQLSKVENDAERVRAAFQILDSEGVQALQANLAGLNRELEQTAGISDAQARSVTRLAETWDKLKEAASSAFLTLGQETGAFQTLTRVLDGLTAFARNPGPLMEHVRQQARTSLFRQAFFAFEGLNRLVTGRSAARGIPPAITAPTTGVIGGPSVLQGGDLRETNRILQQIQRNTATPTVATAQ